MSHCKTAARWSTRQARRIARGSPQGAYHGKRHAEGPSRRQAASCHCIRNAFRARGGAPSACSDTATGKTGSGGDLLLKKLSQVDILPAVVPHIASLPSTSCNRRTDVFLLILMRGRGPRAAALCNGRTTKLPSLCLYDPAAEADVFPFRGGAQTRTGSSCFL